jgi:hypothetical protein
LIRKIKIDCDRQVVLESKGYRSATWSPLRSLQKIHGTEEVWGCTCVTVPTFFSQSASSVSRSSDTKTDKSVVIVWDGLNVKERESEMSWMTTSQSWVFWKQHDSLSSTKNRENEEEKLHSDSEYGEETQNVGWTGGSVRHKNWCHSGQVNLVQSRSTMECWISGWTVPKQEVAETVRGTWMVTISQDKYHRVMDQRTMGQWERASSCWGIRRTQDLSEWTEQWRTRTRRGRRLVDGLVRGTEHSWSCR